MGKEYGPDQDALNAAWKAPETVETKRATHLSSVDNEIELPEDPNAEPLELADDEERVYAEGHKSKGPAEPIRIIPKLDRGRPADRRPPMRKAG